MAGIVIPVKLSAVALAASEFGVVPAHVPVTEPPEALMFTSVSVNAPPVNAAAFGLPMVSVTTLVPPDWIAAGANAFEIVASAKTDRLAVLLAAPAIGVCVVVTPDVVFGFVPSVLLVTLKITVHEPLAGIVMPLKLRAVALAASVFGVVPTHVPPTAPPTAAIFTSVSVNEPLPRAAAFELVSVSVTTLVPPGWMLVGLNAFPIVGGATTVRLAVLLTGPATGV